MCEPVGRVVPPPSGAPDPVAVPVADGGADPRLAELDGLLSAVDQVVARTLDLIMSIEDEAVSESVLGVPLEWHLGVDASRTRADRRMLMQAGEVLRSMPGTHGLLRQGRVTWSQVRWIVQAVARLTGEQRGFVDQAVVDHVDVHAGCEADDLCLRVELLVTEFDPEPDEAREADPGRNRLVLQPRLDGSGRGFFDYGDPVMFTEIADRLDRDAKALLAAPLPASKDPIGAPDDARATKAAATLAEARARVLHQLAVAGGDGAAQPVPPQVSLVVGLDALLDRTQTPGWLLTTLSGGRLKVTGAHARRLIDERGGDLRTVIIDDYGRAVGVGRRRRIPPGWVTTAIQAMDPQCTGPCCRTAACAGGQRDHAVGYIEGGRGDLDSLHLPCASHHRAKTDGVWQVTIRADGIREWRHTVTGWTARSVPATRPFRPPRRQPGRPDPPPD